MNSNAWIPRTGQNRWRWWATYRLAPLATFVGLAGLLGCLVLQPFYHPRVYLLFAAAEYPEALLPPHSLPVEDLAAIHVPQAVLLNPSGAPEPFLRRDGSGRDGLSGRIGCDFGPPGQPRYSGPRRAHGVDRRTSRVESRRGRSALRQFRPAWTCTPGSYPLAKLLTRVRECPAQTKLIVLDSGGTAHAPRLGVFADCSAEQIRTLVEDTKDPGLWVVLSHYDFESSSAIAEPHRSALAQFLGEGLQGAADRNGDRFVDVEELYHYTRERLADWVRSESGGRGSQTAVLLWGGGQTLPGMSYPVVLPVSPKKPADESQQAAGDPNAAPPRTAYAETAVETDRRRHCGALRRSDGRSSAGRRSPTRPGKAAGAKTASDPVLSASAAELQAMAWSLHDRLAAVAGLSRDRGCPAVLAGFAGSPRRAGIGRKIEGRQSAGGR